MEKISINNNVTLKYRSKQRILLKLVIIICALILLLVFLSEFVSGKKINIFSEIFLPTMMMLQGMCLKTQITKYVQIPLEIIFEKNSVYLVYHEIDRKDGHGLHKEQYIFDKENTTNVKSDFVLKSICISGQPRYCAEYRNGKVEEKEETMIEFKIVISDDEEREVIIKKLQKSLARIVYKESDLTSRFK